MIDIEFHDMFNHSKNKINSFFDDRFGKESTMADYFDKSTEKKLLALGRKKYLKTLFLTIAWFLLVIALWVGITRATGRDLLEPSSCLYTLLLILPFYPLRVQRVLFTKTFYGKVGVVKMANQNKSITGLVTSAQIQKEMEEQGVLVQFNGDRGERYTVYYREQSILANHELYYQPGDRVLVIRGLRFPVKYPIPEDAPYVCPVCGHQIKIGHRNCGWCKADFR